MNKKLLLGWLIILLALALCIGCKPEPESAPASPASVNAAAVSNGIKVTWNRVSGADGYYVYRKADTSGNEERTKVQGSSTDEYLDPNGIAGTSYTYAVAAFNSTGTSNKSSWTNVVVFPGGVATEIPAVPSGIQAVAQGADSITVSWNSTPGATGYKIYRDENNTGNFNMLVSGSTPWTGTSYTDTGLHPNKDYFYKVSAVNSAGESGKSVSATAKTGTSSSGSASVDWTSYATNYVFRVRNNTNERLIAFIRNITPGNMLGGVDALENMHGFKKETAVLGTQSSDFPVIFITEAQYNANINALWLLESTPFTRIYGYYNAIGNNETVYEINAGLGGEYTLEVTPSLTRNVELRLEGPHGPTLGYVTKEQHGTYFKLVEGFYRVYPIIRHFNAF